MASFDATVAGTGVPSPAPRSLWRQVAVPTEHGGWSLTAEPVALGLLLAPSWSGLALGSAAVVAFVARTPLKVVLVDRRRKRWLDRTRLALRIATAELVAVVVLACVAVLGGPDASFWWPLMIAAPLVAVELWFDMRSRGRRLVPELAGTVGIGSVVAAIVRAGGASPTVAFGAWLIVSARAVAAIPYARTQVVRAHGRALTLRHNDLGQVVAVGAVTAAWLAGQIPLAPVVALAVIGMCNVAAVRGPVQRAVVIGLQQLAVGLALVVVTAVAMHP